MTQIRKITDKQGNDIYLRTHTKAVVDDNGYTAESRLQAMQDEINQAQLAVGAVPSDLTPTEGSTNWVTSGGVYTTLQGKQDTISALKKVTAEGFSVADGNGNIMLSVNNNGLDTAKLSSHFRSLIGNIGIYEQVTASGFSFADGDGNIMVSINENGLDTARLTTHFKSLVSGQTIDETNDDEVVEKYGLPLLDNMRAEVIEHNLSNRFLNFAFITDTHSEGTHQIFNLNAFKNMKLFRIFCNEKIVDFGLHCGDLYTDYGTSRKEALKLIDSSTQILCDIDCPMFFVKGNHDNNGKGRLEADITNLDWNNKIYSVAKVTNYGLKNASFKYERVYEDTWDGKSTLYEGYGVKSLNITKYQYYLLTQKLADNEVIRSTIDPYGAYYYKDYDELGIRIIVLNFYDKEAQDDTLGYWEAGGLSNTQLTWLNNIALNTENAVIVFSHWYNAVLVSALSTFSNNGGELIALIHGHSHQDQYDNSGGINNIGVRNGFGIATEMNADQNKSFAFSVFTVDTDNKILYETRLGNGVNRSFSYDTPSQIS